MISVVKILDLLDKRYMMQCGPPLLLQQDDRSDLSDGRRTAVVVWLERFTISSANDGGDWMIPSATARPVKASRCLSMSSLRGSYIKLLWIHVL